MPGSVAAFGRSTINLIEAWQVAKEYIYSSVRNNYPQTCTTIRTMSGHERASRERTTFRGNRRSLHCINFVAIIVFFYRLLFRILKCERCKFMFFIVKDLISSCKYHKLVQMSRYIFVIISLDMEFHLYLYFRWWFIKMLIEIITLWKNWLIFSSYYINFSISLRQYLVRGMV